MLLILKLYSLILAVNEPSWNIRAPRAARSSSLPPHIETNQMCGQRGKPRQRSRGERLRVSLPCRLGTSLTAGPWPWLSLKSALPGHAGSVFSQGICALFASSGKLGRSWEVLVSQSLQVKTV